MCNWPNEVLSMRVCVISSGSKGNCTLIQTKNHNILIDIGNSCKYVENTLKNLDILPENIDMIFITHAHIDHVAGLRVFSKKYRPKVYTTEKIYKETNIVLDNVHFINGDIDFEDIQVGIIKTSHDTADSNGYIVYEDKESCVYITDTGYIHERYFKKLSYWKRCDNIGTNYGIFKYGKNKWLINVVMN